jgi:WD40 repeat protein
MTGRFATAPETSAGSEPPRTQALGDAPTQSLGFQVGDDRPSEPPAEGETSSSTKLLSGPSELVYFREVARLGAQVADALDYAHRQKVIHRDIKPSNLLLDDQGNVWVTDFGLAKLVEGEDLSQSRDLVGTLRFMAPERFRGVTDRRGDIYALGATLYEMLALRPVFGERDQVQLIDQIVHQPPTPLRQTDRRVPRDLETIVHKVLAKDPADRCDKAGELRDELRRFLDGRPTRWRRVGPVEQFRRWCKRNPWLATANITAAVLTTVLAIGSTIAAWFYRDQFGALQLEERRTSQARRGLLAQLDLTKKAEARGRERLFESLVSQAEARRLSRRMGQRFETLNALSQAVTIAKELKLPPERLELLRREAIACLALPDLKPTGRVITRPPGTSVAFDSTMTRYALRFRDGMILVRRVDDDREIARFQARGDREFHVFGFSPDGRYLATRNVPDDSLVVWDIDRGRVVLTTPSRWTARFSADSRRIVVEREVEHEGKVLVYDLATGQPLRGWRGPESGGSPNFRPDGNQIAVVYNRTCRVLDAETGGLVRSIPLPVAGNGVAWSPDGTTLAIAGADNKIYLWDAATGIRKATLEGHVNSGLVGAFHPAGALMASYGWEGRLWLWDPILGRPWLTLTGTAYSEISRDGRIVLEHGDQSTTYEVDPALEYRTLAHVSSELTRYGRPSIRHDGRVLAVGGNRGLVLWDLARGTELAFLPLGHGPHSMFDASGDLLTSGATGAQRWPVVLDPDHGEFRIGPPQQLPLPAGAEEIDADRSGRIVALADHGFAFIATPERAFHVGQLDDCRFVTVSPDGEWLATGSHFKNGAQIWRLRDAMQVAHLAIDGSVGVAFSPDVRWLMTKCPPCRLWAVGTWHEARQIGGGGLCFSPDGRLLVLQDASRVLRLVEAETGRTLARLESPDLCAVRYDSAAFSPDGSRLVITTDDGPAVHVWDLRAIRRHLAWMGLDWDAPAFSEDDPASRTLPPLPPLKVDYGPSPLTGHLDPKIHEPLIADLETALTRYPENSQIRTMLARHCNNLAWSLATGPQSARDPQRSLRLSRRAIELVPAAIYLNTLGVAQYREGQYAEAIATLEKSLTAGKGEADAFDLFFLAMARFKLGRVAEARADFDRAVRWRRDHPNLPAQWSEDLNMFQAEAEDLLHGPLAELPASVFAPAPSSRH